MTQHIYLYSPNNLIPYVVCHTEILDIQISKIYMILQPLNFLDTLYSTTFTFIYKYNYLYREILTLDWYKPVSLYNKK